MAIALLCNLLNRKLLGEEIINYSQKIKELQYAFKVRSELKDIETIKTKLNEVVTTETLEQYQDQLLRNAIWEAIVGIDSQIKFLRERWSRRGDLSNIESVVDELKSLPTRSELNRIIEALEEVQQEKKTFKHKYRTNPECLQVSPGTVRNWRRSKNKLTRLATVEALEKLPRTTEQSIPKVQ